MYTDVNNMYILNFMCICTYMRIYIYIYRERHMCTRTGTEMGCFQHSSGNLLGSGRSVARRPVEALEPLPPEKAF